MTEKRENEELSLSLSMTENSLKLSTSSRFLTAVDRLAGNITDEANSFFERRKNRYKSIEAGEREIIGAVTERAIIELNESKELARRAVDRHFGQILQRQINIDAVLLEAKTELEEGTAPEAEDDAVISTDFLDRFEHYASSASEDTIRHRWGQVLAAEVRQPGAFSNKALRVVDEMEPDTARLFEALCSARLENTILKSVSENLTFEQVSSLVFAGLIQDPGAMGHATFFQLRTASDGKNTFWTLGNMEYMIAIPQNTRLSESKKSKNIINFRDSSPGTPIYVLTDAGSSIAKLIKTDTANTLRRFAILISSAAEGEEISIFRNKDAGSFQAIETYVNGNRI